jgi:hypothetical protein
MAMAREAGPNPTQMRSSISEKDVEGEKLGEVGTFLIEG